MIFFNGATGSIGKFLLPALQEFHAVSLQNRLENPEGARGEIANALSTVTRGDSVTLVPLAGLISVDACERDPARARQLNVDALISLVRVFREEVTARGLKPRVLYLSSGHVYASSPAPLSETAPTASRSVYAATKLEAEQALLEETRNGDLNTTILRLFSLIGPGQPSHFLLPGLLRRVAANDSSSIPGLEYFRDYLDARDVCRVIRALLKETWNASEVLNLCSGVPTSIRTLLGHVVKECPLGDRSALLETIQAVPGRPTDVSFLVGDPSRITARLGDRPQKLTLQETVRDAWKAHRGSSDDPENRD